MKFWIYFSAEMKAGGDADVSKIPRRQRSGPGRNDRGISQRRDCILAVGLRILVRLMLLEPDFSFLLDRLSLSAG